MPMLTLIKRVAAPPEAVFATAVDVERFPEAIPGITRVEKLTEGPVGLGTKFKETRKIFGREATETMEFTRFEPGRAYALGCESCGCEYRSDFEFRPDGEGTEITFTLDAIPKSFFAKLMSPLAKLMAGPMKKCVEGDLDSLAKHCEAAARAPA